eukprot:jgi/Tetstr1/440253/TSEL_028604.t1
MDEESRSRTVTNLIRTLSPKIGVQFLQTDVRVVTRRPPKQAAADTAKPIGTRLPTTTGSVILRLARRDIAESVLHTQWTGEGTAILDRQGRRCSTRLLGAPHLDDIERPVHQVWLRSPSFRGLTEADMWLRMGEGLLPAYDQPQPCEAAADQPAAPPADVLALAGVRAWAEYEADTDADDAVICPPDPHTTGSPGNTRTVAGVEMHHYHTEPTLLRVGDNNLCAISLCKEDEEFADTLRLALALTSPVALLRAIRLRWIVIYLTESEFDPSELLIHPFSQTIREAGDMATSPAATATPGAHADEEEELDLNYVEMDSAMEVDTTQGEAAETLVAAVMSLDSPQRSTVQRTFREGTPSGTTERLAELHHLTTAAKELLAQSSPASQPAIAAELASHAAETHQLLNPQRLSIQLEHHPSQPTPGSKGKTATAVKRKKKQPRGRSRSDGATRNRSRSKPRLSGTSGSDNEWETDDDADQPSSSSHQ